MKSKDLTLVINKLIDDLKLELNDTKNLSLLIKCVRAYSSKVHIWNVLSDLELVKKFSPLSCKILDFGCGIGIQSYLLAIMGYEVTGLETVFDKSIDGFLKKKAKSYIESRDKNMTFVWDKIKTKLPTIRFETYNGRDIPYPNDTFDAVFSYAVIEHIPKEDVPRIIGEINRILRPGGVFYIFQLPQIYSYTEFIARQFNIESHKFLWKFSEIINILTKSGFEIILKKRVDMFFNHPYKLVNPFFTLVRIFDEFLLRTPLSFFCHHLTVVAKK